MATMDQGEGIVRRSSKATDHWTVKWKVADDIYQHVDVGEEGKENAFSLGKSLWIGDRGKIWTKLGSVTPTPWRLMLATSSPSGTSAISG
jgi:SH2 domain